MPECLHQLGTLGGYDGIVSIESSKRNPAEGGRNKRTGADDNTMCFRRDSPPGPTTETKATVFPWLVLHSTCSELPSSVTNKFRGLLDDECDPSFLFARAQPFLHGQRSSPLELGPLKVVPITVDRMPNHVSDTEPDEGEDNSRPGKPRRFQQGPRICSGMDIWRRIWGPSSNLNPKHVFNKEMFRV